MGEQLKACWSCGTSEHLRFAGLNIGMKGGQRHIYCDGCYAMGRSAEFCMPTVRGPRGPTEEEAKAEAARLWNARPLEAALEARALTAEARVAELENEVAHWKEQASGFATIASHYLFDPERVKRAELEIAEGKTVPWEQLRAELEQKHRERAAARHRGAETDGEKP